MDALKAEYPVNPLGPQAEGVKQLVVEDKAVVHIEPTQDKNVAVIHSIRALEKGKGFGTEVLNSIMKKADELGISLEGTVKPFGEGGLSEEQLIDFYKKAGFFISSPDETGAIKAFRSPPTKIKLSGFDRKY